MLRRAGEWVLLAAVGVAFGLVVAWVEDAFAIPKNVVAWFWIVVMVAALGFALWTARAYYQAIRDEDEWE